MKISERIAQITQTFDKLVEQKKQIEEEMLRLQGEYRALIALEKEEEPDVKVEGEPTNPKEK